nr:CidA/LrgA family protein [Ornithinibacillus caprae]
MKTVSGIILIIGFYLLGETINTYLLSWVPGSIIGMILLFGLFLVFGEKLVDWVKGGAQLFIKYLPLFFVPVTVGIIQYDNLLSVFGVLFFSLMLVSSFLIILLVSYWMDRKVSEFSCG